MPEQKKEDLGFPANTPWKDMEPAEQVAYWQHQARRHEDRVKAFGDLTPEQITQMQADQEAQRQAALDDQQRAVEAARNEGRQQVEQVLAQERVSNALERALQGRVVEPAALLRLDPSKFVDGQQADVEAITAWVEENSTAPEVVHGNPNLHMGPRKRSEQSKRSAGVSEAERRFGKQQ